MDYEAYKKELLNAFKEKEFIRFDSFIIGEMGYELPKDKGNKEDEKNVRTLAFKKFRESTNMFSFASLPTMRKWFGIGGFACPSRDQVYNICFYLKLDKEKTIEYLQKGLGQPAFFVNDYFEIIFLYGIEHNMEYEQCLDMIDSFEKRMDINVEFSKTHTTKELKKQYEIARDLDPEEFILWMLDRVEWFRGYSQTSLEYLGKIKKAILQDIRENAKEELFLYLMEYDFFAWQKKKKILPSLKKKTEKDEILAYLRRGKSFEKEIPEFDLEIMLELYHMAYGGLEANRRLLAEIYWTSPEDKKRIRKSFPIMTDKHLSDLLNVAEKKEESIKLSWCIRHLSQYPQEEKCPDIVKDILGKYSKEEIKDLNVKEAKEILSYKKRENKRRCLLLQRQDILPMILYLSQRKYEKENNYEYNQKKSRQYFLDMANMAMNTCNMPTLDENNQLDFLLLQCFAKDEMYNYSEIIEMLD